MATAGALKATLSNRKTPGGGGPAPALRQDLGVAGGSTGFFLDG